LRTFDGTVARSTPLIKPHHCLKKASRFRSSGYLMAFFVHACLTQQSPGTKDGF
jgi:hypothetical protein